MKKLILCSSAAVLAMVMTGCIAVRTPVAGTIYTDVQGGEGVTANAGSSKTGTAKAQAILGVAWGDASIKTAAANGGITKIHHVDSHAKSVLGIWGEYTVTVYGE